MTTALTTASTLTASHLAFLAEGGLIYAPAGGAVLGLDGDRYVMRKGEGRAAQAHTLEAGATDAARLAAHWAGFIR